MNVIIQGKGTGDVQDKMNCQVTWVKECVTSSCKVFLLHLLKAVYLALGSSSAPEEGTWRGK